MAVQVAPDGLCMVRAQYPFEAGMKVKGWYIRLIYGSDNIWTLNVIKRFKFNIMKLYILQTI